MQAINTHISTAQPSLPSIERSLQAINTHISTAQPSLPRIKASLHTIETTLSTVQSSLLGAKTFKLNRGNSCVIVFTHRQNEEKNKKGREEKGGKENKERIIRKCKDGDRNVQPAIPRDEEEMISWIDHWARSVGIAPIKMCSCEVLNRKADGLKEHDDLLKSNTVIVLGDAYNTCTFSFQTEMHQNALYRYHMLKDEETVNDGLSYFKDKLGKNGRRIIYTDNEGTECYGLVIITQNPLSPNYDLIILAGNRRLGQRIITEWFKNQNNQQQILDQYVKGYQYFEFV